MQKLKGETKVIKNKYNNEIICEIWASYLDFEILLEKLL